MRARTGIGGASINTSSFVDRVFVELPDRLCGQLSDRTLGGSPDMISGRSHFVALSVDIV
jgi:hypothetical protein